MATRVTVHDSAGHPLAELDGVLVNRSWGLNRIGVAKFSIPKNDPKATERNLRYGNAILIEHDRAGEWGGFIDTPRKETESTIEVTAYEAMSILQYRRPPATGAINGSGGEVFSELIRQSSLAGDSLLRADEIYYGGAILGLRLKYELLYDHLVRLALVTGEEWAVIPDNSAGPLVFKANWYKKRGIFRDWSLEEGTNLRRDFDGFLLEQGQIMNDAIGFVKAANNTAVESSTYGDPASIAKYGLRQGAFSVQDGAQAASKAAAAVAVNKEPRRTYAGLVVLDVDNAFDKVQLGDVVWLRLPNYGFTEARRGTTKLVRIVGRALNDQNEFGALDITADEVIVT